MSGLYPWYKTQGGRAVGKTVIPPMTTRDLRGSVPRDVGYILIRGVGFGVTIRNSNLGEGGFSSLGGPLDLLVWVLRIFLSLMLVKD